MVGSYATTRLSEAIRAVAARLEDPTYVRWAEAELQTYVIEALRVWGALTRSFRQSIVIPDDLTSRYLDLPTVAPTVLGQTVTDRDLVSEIEYHLLEPQGYTTWAGSAQFTLTQIVEALQRRRDRFLLETGLIATWHTLAISSPTIGRLALPEAIMTVRHVGWNSADPSLPSCALLRSDEWDFGSFAPDWIQNPTDLPSAYSVSVTPPLQLQIAPPPMVSGLLDMISIDRGAVLAPSAPTILGVPDDWAWAIKYGALADLLGQDGLSSDLARAAYCEARWRQGVQLASAAPVVLTARINDQTAYLGSVGDADVYRPFWRSELGSPDTVLLAGSNLLTLTPCNPTGVIASSTLDVVRKTPVPQTLVDYLQIGPELLDPLYDYAQATALFKDGPAAVQQAQPLLDRFLRAAGVSAGLATMSSPNRADLEGQTLQDERALPRAMPSEA
jgi:hypothetical protein